jgi:hypothetical protein
MRRAVRLRRHHADRRTVRRKIAGKQPADFNDPVSDAVDGWLCVSGPPAAQGGTCGKDDQNSLAAAAPVE